MAEPELSEAAVLRAAEEATGLSDFGEEGFREGLRMLLRTFEENAFTEKGRRRSVRRVMSLLTTRLKLEEVWKRHPEALRRPIQRPLLLTGLPRSGTSALFNLLAMDPAARPLRLWETQCPDPIEGIAAGAPDPRREAIEAHYARGREKNPSFTKVHYTSADTPEECVLIHAYAFGGVQMGIEPLMEPYASWYRLQDLRPVYAYQKRILQLLDWQRPGERWLLKAPAHLWGLEALVETFPDVCIVWSHRDPLECTASACSMTALLMAGRDGFEKQELGPVVLDFYATSLERGLAARERMDPRRFVDVEYARFVADNLAAVTQIYRHFGLFLPAEALAAMRRHAEANLPGRHGHHDYGLEEYGLTREQVKARFADYVARFDIAVDA